MNFIAINFGINLLDKYITSHKEYNEEELQLLNSFENYLNKMLIKNFQLSLKDIEYIDVKDNHNRYFSHFYSKVFGYNDYKRLLIDRKKLNISYESIEQLIKNLYEDNFFNLIEDPNGHWSCCEECNLSGVDCSINCPNGITLINNDYLFLQIFAQQLDVEDFKLTEEYEIKQKEVGELEDKIIQLSNNYKPLGNN